MTCYLETGSVDPAYNLAFEEYVLRHHRQGDILILWQNRNAVIIGRNQNALEEINRDYVRAQGIQVVRRITGGGAVYHDMGNLNYSFITDALPQEDAANSRFTVPVVNALRQLGLNAESSGRNDILVSGHKVSGTAQYRSGGRILHHGTLLFDSDPDRIAGALRPDPGKFQSKSVKSVRSRVGNIRPLLVQDMDMAAFWKYLTGALSDGFVPGALTGAELAAVRQLKAEKYDTWQWNFGSSPKFDTRIRRRFPGGSLDIRLQIIHGRMEEIQIYGDFLATAPIDPVTQALRGCPYRRDDIRAALEGLPLWDCLGGITGEEFLQAVCDD